MRCIIHGYNFLTIPHLFGFLRNKTLRVDFIIRHQQLVGVKIHHIINYYWPGLKMDGSKYVKNYETCIRSKPTTKHQLGLMRNIWREYEDLGKSFQWTLWAHSRYLLTTIGIGSSFVTTSQSNHAYFLVVAHKGVQLLEEMVFWNKVIVSAACSYIVNNHKHWNRYISQNTVAIRTAVSV